MKDKGIQNELSSNEINKMKEIVKPVYDKFG